MRRIGRRMLNALTGLSLLLCVVVITIMIRSQFVADTFGESTRGESANEYVTRSVIWGKGLLSVQYFSIKFFTDREYQECEPWTHIREPASAVTYGGAYWGGFDRFTISTDTKYSRIAALTVRLWMVAVVFAVLPGIKMGALVRQRRRRRNGKCLNCGYDLQGNVSGVCPECGRKIAEAK